MDIFNLWIPLEVLRNFSNFGSNWKNGCQQKLLQTDGFGMFWTFWSYLDMYVCDVWKPMGGAPIHLIAVFQDSIANRLVTLPFECYLSVVELWSYISRFCLEWTCRWFSGFEIWQYIYIIIYIYIYNVLIFWAVTEMYLSYMTFSFWRDWVVSCIFLVRFLNSKNDNPKLPVRHGSQRTTE